MHANSSTAAPSDDQLNLIAQSFARLTGRQLAAEYADIRTALWNCPTVIVAHGTERDPIFFYGNRAALTLFELDFATFTKMPSRFSAEPLAREARSELLARVSRDGFIDDYSGIRISATGKRFWIEQAVVWNLIDVDGGCHGQAATFARWTAVDS